MLQTDEKPTPSNEGSNPQSISPLTVSPPSNPVAGKTSDRAYWFGIGSIVVLVALLSYGLGAMMTLSTRTADTTGTSTTSSGMDMSTSQDTSNVPNATQEYGNQPAAYTIDSDGAKHFHFTAMLVMWDVTGGHRVLAWSINGMVPGPMIRVTANDHVRITLVNHFPKPTALHWHGLEVPTEADGVPGLGQNVIQPGQTYVYNFTVHDQDVGTHWYHSHYDDQEQVGSGCYGLFIVDPRPGTPQAAQAIHADVDYTEFIGMLDQYYVLSGKSYPDTQPINVKQGQTVHLRFIGADINTMHPMHLHGHTLSIVAEDGHMLPQPIQKDTIPVAPGETYDMTFKAWASPGSVYPLHCHILSHLMNPGQSADEMGGLLVLVKYAK